MAQTVMKSIYILIFSLTKAFAYIDANNSDIFIAYSGHSEVGDDKPVLIPTPESETSKAPQPETNKKEDDVIFVPNEKPVVTIEDDYLVNDGVKISDVINNRRIGDVIRDDTLVEDPTANDMIFISGKNNENDEKKERKNKHNDAKKTDKETKHIRLDCANLDCANSVQSVCGGKPEGKKLRYRLFLNECFFRKVNCAFKYPNNRYKMVAPEKCSNIGSHTEGRPASQSIGMPFSNAQDDKEITITFSSRRSLNADITGLSCSHPCPVSCTERYEPQCAMSPTGHRRTFLNHCQLDYHSCLNGVVWRIRPLSECVGGRKAELQQNRGFIAWMQKVGIVDNRGRLTLSKAPR